MKTFLFSLIFLAVALPAGAQKDNVRLGEALEMKTVRAEESGVRSKESGVRSQEPPPDKIKLGEKIKTEVKR